MNDEQAPLAQKLKPQSRPKRWADACQRAFDAIDAIVDANNELMAAVQDLNDLKSEYEEWQGNLPESLATSPLGEKLQAVVDLDLDNADLDDAVDAARDAIQEADGLELPRGFGKD